MCPLSALKKKDPWMTVIDFQALGRRLADQRRVGQWTQKEVAQHAAVSPTLVAEVERGERPRVSLAAVVKICEALGGLNVHWVVYNTTGRLQSSPERRGDAI
jgi:transcriptional regulator with XRE-family HTH domain